MARGDLKCRLDEAALEIVRLICASQLAFVWLRCARSSQLSEAPEVNPEMFESLASCFAFRCSGSLNMTETVGKTKIAGKFSIVH